MSSPDPAAPDPARQAADRQARRERLARFALWITILAFPLVYLPRLAVDAAPEPLPQQPSWVHALVVTASRWPAQPDTSSPGLALLERRASHPRQVYATTPSQAGSAASLWTGRWAASHGVVSNDLALPSGAWTWVDAARASGARTAAFLQEPFVTATGLGGFEVVVESPTDSAQQLAEAAVSFLGEHDGERVVCWIHLVHAGPGGRDVDALLQALQADLDARAARFDTLTLVTGFGTDDSAPDSGAETDAGGAQEPARANDRWARVPFWLELPSALYAGRGGGGALSLVDPAGVLVDLMRLPPPDESAGQAPLESRVPNATNAIKGGGGFEWLFLHGPRRTVLRHGRTRIVAESGASDSEWLVQRTDDPARDQGFVPVPAAERKAQLAQFRELERRIDPRGAPAVPAQVPAAWRGRFGW